MWKNTLSALADPTRGGRQSGPLPDKPRTPHLTSAGAGNAMAARLGIATPIRACPEVPLLIGFVSVSVTLSVLIAATTVNELALALLSA